MIDAKQIATPQALGAPGHLFDGHATDSGGSDECTNARPRVHARLDVSLFESAQDTDVCETLHAAAAQHEGDALATATTAGLFHHRRSSGSFNSLCSRSLQILVQPVKANDGPTNHEDGAGIVTNDRANENGGASDDHQRLALSESGGGIGRHCGRRRNGRADPYGQRVISWPSVGSLNGCRYQSSRDRSFGKRLSCARWSTERKQDSSNEEQGSTRSDVHCF